MTSPAKAIVRLERRLLHLEERIQRGELDGRDLSYDKSERAAIRLALRELRKLYEAGGT